MNLSLQFGNRKPATNGWMAPIEDVKKQISEQVEHLVDVAGQVSREVAAQAAQATSEVEAKAGAAASAATSAANSAATEVPAAANTLRQRALLGARQLGKELRAVRITTEPPRSTRPSVAPGIALLGGLSAGLALMYFADPVEGRHRRALLRDQLTKWTRMGRDKATETAGEVRESVEFEGGRSPGRRPGDRQWLDAVARFGSVDDRDDGAPHHLRRPLGGNSQPWSEPGGR